VRAGSIIRTWPAASTEAQTVTRSSPPQDSWPPSGPAELVRSVIPRLLACRWLSSSISCCSIWFRDRLGRAVSTDDAVLRHRAVAGRLEGVDPGGVLVQVGLDRADQFGGGRSVRPLPALDAGREGKLVRCQVPSPSCPSALTPKATSRARARTPRTPAAQPPLLRHPRRGAGGPGGAGTGGCAELPGGGAYWAGTVHCPGAASWPGPAGIPRALGGAANRLSGWAGASNRVVGLGRCAEPVVGPGRRCEGRVRPGPRCPGRRRSRSPAVSLAVPSSANPLADSAVRRPPLSGPPGCHRLG